MFLNGVLLLTVLAIISTVNGQERLVDRGIYTFQNKGDLGFLTAIGGRASFADSDTWRDGPAQKWRVVKAYFGNSYMLKPTSDEATSIYTDGGQGVSIAGSGLALSNTQYWTIWLAEQGFYTIRNEKTEECLESPGLGKRVIVTRCRNVREQQWAMHRR